MIPDQKSSEPEDEICHKTDDLPDIKAKAPLAAVQTNEVLYEANKTKTPAGINNVKLAQFNGDEQKVIIESNAWQMSPDVILVQKGVRANWVFRLKSSEECNGKILIEKFGMIIPVTGREMSFFFAPWKDFTIACDQGKFNYYVKVVENLAASTASANGDKNLQKTVSKDQESKPASQTPKKTKPVPAVKQKENIKQKADVRADTQVSEPAPGKESSVESKQPTTVKEEPVKQPEEKKGGILDHLLHHNH